MLLANAPALVRSAEVHRSVLSRVRARGHARRAGYLRCVSQAGSGIGDTHWLSRAETIAQLPGVRVEGLRGGVSYWDAQFDDARLAIALMRTSVRLGAVALNYVEADRIESIGGRVTAIVARDAQTSERFELRAKVVFNATGVWADELRRRVNGEAAALITASRGSHIVLPASFLPSSTGMMIPKTADGRVLFAIPWHGHLMVGTTDVAVAGPSAEPEASDAEVEFIVDTARGYLQAKPSAGDVLATFAGLRPLFSPRDARVTKTISREHAIVIEHHNLITIVGGKWTTYRRMALDALDHAADSGLLDARPCTTSDIKLDVDDSIEAGCHAAEIAAINGSGDSAITRFVGTAARYEQALKPEDVIARRLRVKQMSSRAAARIRPLVEKALTALQI